MHILGVGRNDRGRDGGEDEATDADDQEGNCGRVLEVIKDQGIRELGRSIGANLKNKVEEFVEEDIEDSKSTIGTLEGTPLTPWPSPGNGCTMSKTQTELLGFQNYRCCLCEPLLFRIQDDFYFPVALLILQKSASRDATRSLICARSACP
ncbi:hypothetical protein ARMSODRAFT_802288 [Armillaria solidipes]|uniref:Uncharacterized protein n=1 Tax=Armillaria solidipes TaxID=1076256 RepID=A0A2H3ARD7_9AGAR|nr:hypothetical protein ARMSODRAFT_802288 [Armillaria solidipes]